MRLYLQGMTYTGKVIGSNDEKEVIDDRVSQVGKIRVSSLSRLYEVHRITETVRKMIVKRSLLKETQKGKVGRPRKLDF